MNLSILKSEVQRFIDANLNEDITKLLFKKSPFNDVSSKELVEQIEAKKRSKTKLPTWFNSQNIYFPNKLNIEQTSSEITAEYKSKLVYGPALIDLTSGLGVDSFYFSKKVKNVTSCELNLKLSEISKYNFKNLEVNNISVINENGIEYINKSNLHFDCIYVDPSRRHNSKGKVFFLRDCLPNIPEYIDMLFKHSNTILIKASPMLDISIGISELKYVKEVHIVAIENEVKELLFLLEFSYQETIKIKTANITKGKTQCFEFYKNEEAIAKSSIEEATSYLYEPNAALLKSGAFNLISTQLHVPKLHKHTHLYTSEKLIDFPGRRFKIETILDYNKKLLKRYLKDKKINISTRNFPISIQQLKKDFHIKDGGKTYAFFTTDINDEKKVIITSKI